LTIERAPILYLAAPTFECNSNAIDASKRALPTPQRDGQVLAAETMRLGPAAREQASPGEEPRLCPCRRVQVAVRRGQQCLA
jgi:hypothetical protein